MTVSQFFFLLFCVSILLLIWHKSGIRNAIVWSLVIQWVLYVIYLIIYGLAVKTGVVLGSMGAVIGG